MALPDQSTEAAAPVAPQSDLPPLQDNGQLAYNYFVSQGYAPHQAAGIVGNLQGESGQGLNPSAVNRGDGRDGSDSIGIGQWNGTRAQALKDYAASKGTSVNDLNTQLEFLHTELNGSEKAAKEKLMAATTPQEAGQAMLAYERPKDWNKPGAHPERAQYAARAYSVYGGQPQPQAAPAPANAAPAQPQPAALPAPQAPIFAQAPQAAPQAPAMPQMPAPPQMPIFAPQRRQIDLSGLKAALAARAPIFPGQG